MTNPSVSAIVPIYKVKDYLVQCVDSILAQSLANIEVILIDEGDDDECYAIMRMFAAADTRVKLIHERSGGYGASCNKGFDSATGEYVIVIESDDFIEPTMFESLYNQAKAENLDVVKGPFFKYYDEHQISSPYRVPCEYAEFFAYSAPSQAFTVDQFPELMAVHASIWSALYRTDFIRKNRIYFVDRKPAAYVDVEFRIRTLVEAERIGWCATPFYNWRLTNTGSTTNNFNLTTMIRRWQEAHDYFAARNDGLYEKIGQYLILDEFYNTYNIFFLPRTKATNQDFLAAKANISRISAETWLKSPVLTSEQRGKMEIFAKARTMRDLSAFWLAPPSTLWPPTRGRNMKRYLNYLPIRVRFKSDEARIRILPSFRRRLFSAEFYFFRVYAIHIEVGSASL